MLFLLEGSYTLCYEHTRENRSVGKMTGISLLARETIVVSLGKLLYYVTLCFCVYFRENSAFIVSFFSFPRGKYKRTVRCKNIPHLTMIISNGNQTSNSHDSKTQCIEY